MTKIQPKLDNKNKAIKAVVETTGIEQAAPISAAKLPEPSAIDGGNANLAEELLPTNQAACWSEEFSEPLDELLTSAHYPQLSPVGDGTMPLSAAIHWIATEGLKLEFLLIHAESGYRSAAEEMQNKIISGKIVVHGENLDGDREAIPAIEFEDLRFTFDFVQDLADVAGHDRRIEVGVSEDGDCLFKPNSHLPIWTKLVFQREDVRREWPFHLVTEESAYTVIPDEPFRGAKVEAARKGLLQEFPDGQVPNQLSIAKVVDRLNRRQKKSGDPGGFERTTVLRALGLKK